MGKERAALCSLPGWLEPPWALLSAARPRTATRWQQCASLGSEETWLGLLGGELAGAGGVRSPVPCPPRRGLGLCLHRGLHHGPGRVALSVYR